MNSLKVIFMPNLSASFDITFIIEIESPPNCKKLSYIPTLSIPNTSFHISAISFSSFVLGSTKVSFSIFGFGKAFLFTFPFAFNGNSSIFI